jgi:hypothetical protein
VNLPLVSDQLSCFFFATRADHILDKTIYYFHQYVSLILFKPLTGEAKGSGMSIANNFEISNIQKLLGGPHK